MTKGEIYLVVLSIQLFILVVIFFVVRVVLNPPKNIIKSFIIVDGNLYARCQQGHIALIKPPQPICIKDIVRIKLNQSISFMVDFQLLWKQGWENVLRSSSVGSLQCENSNGFEKNY